MWNLRPSAGSFSLSLPIMFAISLRAPLISSFFHRSIGAFHGTTFLHLVNDLDQPIIGEAFELTIHSGTRYVRASAVKFAGFGTCTAEYLNEQLASVRIGQAIHDMAVELISRLSFLHRLGDRSEVNVDCSSISENTHCVSLFHRVSIQYPPTGSDLRYARLIRFTYLERRTIALMRTISPNGFSDGRPAGDYFMLCNRPGPA